jgi:ABC-2 type transport system permease protein
VIVLTGTLFPLIGLSEWALSPPAGMSAALLFAGSMVLVVALASAISTLMDILTVATLSDRGVNTVIGPLVIVLCGNLIPLPLFPDWLQPMLALQPFAGLVTRPSASTPAISPAPRRSPLSLVRRSGRSSSSHSADC